MARQAVAAPAAAEVKARTNTFVAKFIDRMPWLKLWPERV
jgi:hypothetical protein